MSGSSLQSETEPSTSFDLCFKILCCNISLIVTQNANMTEAKSASELSANRLGESGVQVGGMFSVTAVLG